MNKSWLEISVGTFIVAGIAALLMLAVQVGGHHLSRSTDTYRLTALFDNTAGLAVRAQVTLSGVTIGKVVAINIDKDQLMARVDMDIQAEIDYLSLDSTASILTSGLLGEKYIGITVGAEEASLKHGDQIADTQSALVLEDLIGRMLVNMAQ